MNRFRSLLLAFVPILMIGLLAEDSYGAPRRGRRNRKDGEQISQVDGATTPQDGSVDNAATETPTPTPEPTPATDGSLAVDPASAEGGEVAPQVDPVPPPTPEPGVDVVAPDVPVPAPPTPEPTPTVDPVPAPTPDNPNPEPVPLPTPEPLPTPDVPPAPLPVPPAPDVPPTPAPDAPSHPSAAASVGEFSHYVATRWKGHVTENFQPATGRKGNTVDLLCRLRGVTTAYEVDRVKNWNRALSRAYDRAVTSNADRAGLVLIMTDPAKEWPTFARAAVAASAYDVTLVTVDANGVIYKHGATTYRTRDGKSVKRDTIKATKDKKAKKSSRRRK